MKTRRLAAIATALLPLLIAATGLLWAGCRTLQNCHGEDGR